MFCLYKTILLKDIFWVEHGGVVVGTFALQVPVFDSMCFVWSLDVLTMSASFQGTLCFSQSKNAVI